MSIKNTVIKAYPYVLGLIILILVWREFSQDNVINIFSELSIWIVIFCFLFYFVIKIANTLRYAHFFKIKNLVKLFFVLNLANFILNFVPFRLGEYSYIKLFKSRFNIEHKLSISRLLVVRLFDYVVLLIFFIFSSLFVLSYFSPKFSYLYVIFILPLVALILLLYIFIKSNKVLGKYKIYQTVRLGILEVRTYGYLEIVVLLFNSIIYWGLRFSFGYLLIFLLGIKISFLLVTFITCILLIIGLIPIQVFSNFGIFEFSWIYFLGVLNIGISEQEIFNKIIIFHVVPLIPVIIIGIISYLALRHSSSK